MEVGQDNSQSCSCLLSTYSISKQLSHLPSVLLNSLHNTINYFDSYSFSYLHRLSKKYLLLLVAASCVYNPAYET